MASTTRKRWGLGGGGKRGGGGGGRKNPTKTRKTTTTTFTTTTTKDAEKKNPCVDFLSLFFFSFSGGAVKNKRNFATRACARGIRALFGSPRAAGARQKTSVFRDGSVASFSFSARPRGRIRFFVLSLTHTTFQLSFSLSLSQRARADSGVLYASSSGRF